jgi:hypothetical protein
MDTLLMYMPVMVSNMHSYIAFILLQYALQDALQDACTM